MKKWNKYLIIALTGLFTFTACADLDVENLNEPDKDLALANPDDLIGLASGTFRTFLAAAQAEDGFGMAMGVMADANTCSWGNFSMRDCSSEPRTFTWNNAINYSYFQVNTYPWQDWNSALSSANDVLKEINAGVTLGPGGSQTDLVKAFCYFVQGCVHGYVGMCYDRGNIIDENTDISDVSKIEFFSYKEVAQAGIAMLQKALDVLAATTDFTLPSTFVRGMTLTKDDFEQMVRTYMAKVMISWPRNATEAQEIVWADVLNVLTQGKGGLDYDLAPEMGAGGWYDYAKVYMIYPGWGRTDHRLINLMDTDYPSRWPWDGVWPAGDPGPASSPDARLESDFEYLPTQGFIAARGYYHFSHYRWQRYDWWIATAWYGVGNSVVIAEWEARMLEAEALLRTNNKAGAIAILNSANGARKVRGGLADIDAAATKEEVLDAILYEKEIECHNTNHGMSFFDMRRNNMLQYGTLQQWPLPTNEQEISNIPQYTIGGKEPDGIDRAKYGWVGKDGLVSPVGGWPGYPAKPDIIK